MKQFPASHLVPCRARLWALVFENPQAKVPLDLWWSLSVEFAAIMLDGNSLDCNLTADWVRLPGVRDWRALDGVHVSGGMDIVNASFYTEEHGPVVRSAVWIDRRHGATFRLRWSAVVDLSGWGDPHLEPTTTVNIDVPADFDGVFIYQGLLETESDTERAANRLASQFIDLKTLGPFEKWVNEFDVMQYRFPPMGGA